MNTAAQTTTRPFNGYRFEFAFLALVVLVSIAGFWELYFGADAAPNAHQHLHVATNFGWLSLLIWQLRLIGNRNFATHRKIGLSVLVAGPLLFATTAMLSVHSAHKGLVSGQGDFLIVQNVGVTLELGLLILLAFVARKRRKLHGYFMLSTGILFLGIALFFALISFVTNFRIEGPETFNRFAQAAITGQVICLGVGLIFLIRDFRNAWPVMLAALFFLVNEAIRAFLAQRDLLQPLTEFVGSLSEPITFATSGVVLLILLLATGVQNSERRPV